MPILMTFWKRKCDTKFEQANLTCHLKATFWSHIFVINLTLGQKNIFLSQDNFFISTNTIFCCCIQDTLHVL